MGLLTDDPTVRWTPVSVYPPGIEVRRSAELSEDGRYRYRLIRRWSQQVLLPFLLINPSTADADEDDPTIRRCVGFAHSMGFGGVGVWNLFAYRATNPRVLWETDDEITGGWENDHRLRNLLLWASEVGVPVIAGWGINAPEARVEWLLDQVGTESLHALAITRDGHPCHPLYLKATCRARPWPEGSR